VESRLSNSNDPANPLMQVAALTLDKVYVDMGPPPTFKVMANLNFKRTGDMSGNAQAKDGRDVTVTFGLSLKRASLTLSFESEDAHVGHDPVELRDVAFISSVAVSSEMERQRRDSSGVNRESSAGAALGFSGDPHTPSAKASINAAAGLKREAQSRRETSTVAKNRFVNINATFSSNAVHWEVEPNVPAETVASGPGHISGEVFRNEDGTAVAACVARVKSRILNPVVVRGSVSVNFQDLSIEDIDIVDSVGEPLRPQSVRGGCEGFFGRGNVAEMKVRIVKEIIRNQLIEEGMRVDGARIEICRAHT
jgi:hypothetical protein